MCPGPRIPTFLPSLDRVLLRHRSARRDTFVERMASVWGPLRGPRRPVRMDTRSPPPVNAPGQEEQKSRMPLGALQGTSTRPQRGPVTLSPWIRRARVGSGSTTVSVWRPHPHLGLRRRQGGRLSRPMAPRQEGHPIGFARSLAPSLRDGARRLRRHRQPTRRAPMSILNC